MLVYRVFTMLDQLETSSLACTRPLLCVRRMAWIYKHPKSGRWFLGGALDKNGLRILPELRPKRKPESIWQV
jgi:hypothetical protein